MYESSSVASDHTIWNRNRRVVAVDAPLQFPPLALFSYVYSIPCWPHNRGFMSDTRSYSNLSVAMQSRLETSASGNLEFNDVDCLQSRKGSAEDL